MKRSLFALLAVAMAAAGCHAQVPPSSNSVVLTWTAPSSPACTTSDPCAYVLSRYTLPSGTATCPPATTQYAALNQSSPAAGTTYTDTAPPAGTNVCYVAQTVQGGLYSAPSGPSNSGTPIAVPTLPTAPSSLGTTSVSETIEPLPLPLPTPALRAANGAPMGLAARVRYR